MSIKAAARGVIERRTRNWIYKRHLPTRFGGGPIFVTPSAGLRYLFKSMANVDPPLLTNALTLVQPGDIVWDIGANVGLFTFAAASMAGPKGRVIAFEPDIFLAELLNRSAMVQPPISAPVSIIPAAVADKVAVREFSIAGRSRASNALWEYGQTQMGRISKSHPVITLNLDWLAARLPKPNIIKCDVEGAEGEVFVRQKVTLAKLRPIIITEVADASAAALGSAFSQNKYVLFDGDKPLSKDARAEHPCWNTVAIPEETLHRYVSLPS